ncbi:hypothetical protein B0H11DRAFT_2309558 [Mycena galericulata]|nr:hypothetical protein B0H11DRAFT_2309558 [Mycena galericulata]
MRASLISRLAANSLFRRRASPFRRKSRVGVLDAARGVRCSGRGFEGTQPTLSHSHSRAGPESNPPESTLDTNSGDFGVGVGFHRERSLLLDFKSRHPAHTCTGHYFCDDLSTDPSDGLNKLSHSALLLVQRTLDSPCTPSRPRLPPRVPQSDQFASRAKPAHLEPALLALRVFPGRPPDFPPSIAPPEVSLSLPARAPPNPPFPHLDFPPPYSRLALYPPTLAPPTGTAPSRSSSPCPLVRILLCFFAPPAVRPPPSALPLSSLVFPYERIVSLAYDVWRGRATSLRAPSAAGPSASVMQVPRGGSEIVFRGGTPVLLGVSMRRGYASPAPHVSSRSVEFSFSFWLHRMLLIRMHSTGTSRIHVRHPIPSASSSYPPLVVLPSSAVLVLIALLASVLLIVLIAVFLSMLIASPSPLLCPSFLGLPAPRPPFCLPSSSSVIPRRRAVSDAA